jgi:hypothetical protein
VANLYDRPISNQTPNLFDLRIGHGDATVRPIIKPMLYSQPLELGAESVDQYVSARAYAEFPRVPPILFVRIRDMQT